MAELKSMVFGGRTFSICLMVVLMLVQFVTSQDVMGCGGFVRTNKNIDVTRIQMTLFSKKNGNLR
jgi:hypothetical protein